MPAKLTLTYLRDVAQDSFDRAKANAERRNIPVKLARKSFSDAPVMMSNAAVREAQTISDDPDFCVLERYDAMRAWAAFVSFDLRKSSKRATRIGPRDTYITMHTYMPTMLEVIKGMGGTVVGLRGDGAIAMLGVVKLDDPKRRVQTDEGERAAGLGCECGQGLVECVVDVINPVLAKGGVEAGLAVGVGVDVGEFVATRIGIERAYDLTAYGDCVNKACHRSDHGHNRVVVTNDVRVMFPEGKGGKTTFPDVPNQTDAYFLKYPDYYRAIR